MLISSIVYADTAIKIPDILKPTPESKLLAQANTQDEENENVVLIFALGDKEYFVNGELLTMDVSPAIVESRTLLPDPTPGDNVWDPANDPMDYKPNNKEVWHAMLLVSNLFDLKEEKKK